MAHVMQALPRGQRRRLKVRLPFLATVDNAAPKSRQSAYGPAQYSAARLRRRSRRGIKYPVLGHKRYWSQAKTPPLPLLGKK
jgi:hypothetical protein